MERKYQFFDGKSKVITPIGEELTAQQWIERYPWCKYTKMVIGGGVINGSCALLFTSLKDMWERRGADFSDCKDDEEILAKIEKLEDEPAPQPKVLSDDERIANALEDLVLLTELNMEV